jgi:uncharacterized repeat protein (TIGR03809 family)
MASQLDVAKGREIVARWCNLAERRLDYLTELFDSGRWRRFHSEEAFLQNVREAKVAVEAWRDLLSREASRDNRPIDLSWLGRGRTAPPQNKFRRDAKTQDYRPTDYKPADDRPFDPKPFDPKPLDTKPIDTKSFDSRPVGFEPPDFQPLNFRPSRPAAIWPLSPTTLPPVEDIPVAPPPEISIIPLEDDVLNEAESAVMSEDAFAAVLDLATIAARYPILRNTL